MIKRCASCGCEFDGHGNAKYCVECRVEVKSEQRRRWLKANPEKQREYVRRWEKAHPEKKREYLRRYRERHREQIREYSRRRYIKSKLAVLRGENPA